MITKRRLFSLAYVLLIVISAGCLPKIAPEANAQNSSATEPIVTPTFTVQPTQMAIQTVTPVLDNSGNKPFPTATPASSSQISILAVQVTPATGGQSIAKDAPCYQAKFLKNVTIADGAGFQPSEPIMKMWRIQNIGSCEWSANTRLAFAHGIDFDAPPSLPIGISIPPGAIIDLAINVKTPPRSGIFQGFWKLQNDMGVPIEMVDAPNSEIALKIVVFIPDTPEPGLAFDFTSNFCSAEWTNQNGLLACPSKQLAGEDGGMMRSFTPWLENNTQDNEPALLLLPAEGANGFIEAKYSKYKVQEGDRFKSVIGCQRKMLKCKVTFSVDYTEDGITVKNLLTYTEVFDGNIRHIDQSLDQLKGKTVQFILRVDNNTSSIDDQVFWLWPRITNPNLTK